MKCNCGSEATCVGSYEGHGHLDFGCDDCCGHGNEDGWCLPVDDPDLQTTFRRHFVPVERVDEELEAVARELEKRASKYDGGSEAANELREVARWLRT